MLVALLLWQLVLPPPPVLVNINTASVQELQTLPGVGPVISTRIVAYRDLHGPYKVIEDLLNVSGIGVALFTRIRPLVVTTTVVLPPPPEPITGVAAVECFALTWQAVGDAVLWRLSCIGAKPGANRLDGSTVVLIATDDQGALFDMLDAQAAGSVWVTLERKKQ